MPVIAWCSITWVMPQGLFPQCLLWVFYAAPLSGWHPTAAQGTPIMIGGGVLAYTLLGIDYNESSGACAFLVPPSPPFCLPAYYNNIPHLLLCKLSRCPQYCFFIHQT